MDSWTLTEAAKVLGVSQHTLIHLCEKRVVVPDVRDARGRGSSRAFSRRNMFDFAVALEMRGLELPVTYVRAVLRVLHAFETEAKKLRGGFSLPDSLLVPKAPQLSLVIVDGARVYFSVGDAKASAQLFGGVNIRRPHGPGRARGHQGVGKLGPARSAEVIDSARTKTEIDLLQIAKDLGERL
jgi:DNA-binding transcriptional MerR regulator